MHSCPPNNHTFDAIQAYLLLESSYNEQLAKTEGFF